MKYNYTSEAGLSAVELLITLFIAAMFLMAGYLLWGFTVQGSAEASQSSIASNIAYDYAKQYRVTTGCKNATTTPSAPAVTTPVVTPALVTNVTPTNSAGIPNPKVTVTATCTQALYDLKMVLITSTVTYGNNPVKTVSHAVYAN